MAEHTKTDPAELSRKWADAPTLREFLKAEAELLRHAEQDDEKFGKPLTEMSDIEISILALRGQSALTSAINAAKRKISDDLIAARVACIGRPRDSAQLERIPPSFWIGSEIDWTLGSVARGDEVFIDLRVISEGLWDRASHDDSEPTTRRPSVEAVIMAAIETYAETDPHLDQPFIVRRRAYRIYIASQGYDPHNDRGFSDKNFEKYETVYRRKFK